MTDLFIPNYKATKDETQIAFGCVGSSIMIAFGLDDKNRVKVNAKLADFGHGSLFSLKNYNHIIKSIEENDSPKTHDKMELENNIRIKDEMDNKLGYIENMTIGAYQLYNMFYQYCKAYDIVAESKLDTSKYKLGANNISKQIKNNTETDITNISESIKNNKPKTQDKAVYVQHLFIRKDLKDLIKKYTGNKTILIP
jgi:hypothetical protein